MKEKKKYKVVYDYFKATPIKWRKKIGKWNVLFINNQTSIGWCYRRKFGAFMGPIGYRDRRLRKKEVESFFYKQIIEIQKNLKTKTLKASKRN